MCSLPLGFTGANPDMCLHIWLAGQGTKCWYMLWVIACTHGRSFSAIWLGRALRRVHWRCVTWCRAHSDVKPLKPQSNDKQMEHVETAAKIFSSLNRISCCLFLEKWNHTTLENFFSFRWANSNSWEVRFSHTFYSYTLSQMSRVFSQQKTRWVFSCFPLPGMKNLLVELEMPASNTQCCCILCLSSPGWSLALQVKRQGGNQKIAGSGQCFPEQKTWVKFQVP